MKGRGPCFAFQHGKCSRGGECRFSHEKTASVVPSKKRKKTDGLAAPYKRVQYGVDIEASSCVNLGLEAYYSAQNIVPQGEWDAFQSSLRTSLPAAVRVSCFRPGAPKVAAALKAHPQFSQIGWCPGGVAYRCPNDAYHADEMKDFKEWIKKMNSGGTLTFQEEVSLLPPLLLAVQSHHTVLDMCAAPGSKTLELLELMHQHTDNAKAADALASGTNVASGVLVANDSDSKRVNNILVGRLRKLHTPAVLVTVGNAAKFPALTSAGAGMLQYDRILADVPCSGDGTIRKEPTIWQSWQPTDALQMFRVQVRILRRALALVKVGGRVVYSTCSMNPIENEAVVCAVLASSNGSVKIAEAKINGVELASTGLKVCPGLETWRVPDTRTPGCTAWFTKFSEVPAELRKPDRRLTVIDAAMFPPMPGKTDGLKYCIRVLPHHNDTGGFFSAVLEKTAPLDNELEGPAAAASAEKATMEAVKNVLDSDNLVTAANSIVQQPRLEVALPMFHNNQTVTELKWDSETGGDLRTFYGLTANAGRVFSMADKSMADRTVVFVSSAAAEWLVTFAESRRSISFKQVQFAAVGVRLFKKMKSDYVTAAPSRWRPCQEGAAVLARIASNRIIRVPRHLMVQLVCQGTVLLTDLISAVVADPGAAPWLMEAATAVAAGDDPLDRIVLGGVIVGLLPTESAALDDRVWVAGVFGKKGIEAFASKAEVHALLEDLDALVNKSTIPLFSCSNENAERSAE